MNQQLQPGNQWKGISLFFCDGLVSQKEENRDGREREAYLAVDNGMFTKQDDFSWGGCEV